MQPRKSPKRSIREWVRVGEFRTGFWRIYDISPVNDHIWVAGNGIEIFDKKGNIVSRIQTDKGDVNSIQTVGGNEVWVGGSGRWCKVHRFSCDGKLIGRIAAHKRDDASEWSFISKIACIGEFIWMGGCGRFGDGEIHVYNKNGESLTSLKLKYDDSSLNAIALIGDAVWIGGSLYCVPPGGAVIHRYDLNGHYQDEFYCEGHPIEDLILRDDEVWIVRLFSETIKVFSPSGHFLRDSYIGERDITAANYVDDELWIGSSSAIVRFKRRPKPLVALAWNWGLRWIRGVSRKIRFR